MHSGTGKTQRQTHAKPAELPIDDPYAHMSINIKTMLQQKMDQLQPNTHHKYNLL